MNKAHNVLTSKSLTIERHFRVKSSCGPTSSQACCYILAAPLAMAWDSASQPGPPAEGKATLFPQSHWIESFTYKAWRVKVSPSIYPFITRSG